MDIKQKTLIIVSIIIILVFVILGYFLVNSNKKINKLVEQNNKLIEKNTVLLSKSKNDSIGNELTKQSYGKEIIIKYIERKTIHDSIVFFNSSVSDKERIFSEHTKHY